MRKFSTILKFPPSSLLVSFFFTIHTIPSNTHSALGEQRGGNHVKVFLWKMRHTAVIVTSQWSGSELLCAVKERAWKKILYSNFIFLFTLFSLFSHFLRTLFYLLLLPSLPPSSHSHLARLPWKILPIFLVNEIIKFSQTHRRRRRRRGWEFSFFCFFASAAAFFLSFSFYYHKIYDIINMLLRCLYVVCIRTCRIMRESCFGFFEMSTFLYTKTEWARECGGGEEGKWKFLGKFYLSSQKYNYHFHMCRVPKTLSLVLVSFFIIRLFFYLIPFHSFIMAG